MAVGSVCDQLVGLRLADLYEHVLVAAASPAVLQRHGCELRWSENEGADGSRRLVGLTLPFGKDVYDLARDLARTDPDTPVLLCRALEGVTDLRGWIALPSPVDPDLQVGTLGKLL